MNKTLNEAAMLSTYTRIVMSNQRYENVSAWVSIGLILLYLIGILCDCIIRYSLHKFMHKAMIESVPGAYGYANISFTNKKKG